MKAFVILFTCLFALPLCAQQARTRTAPAPRTAAAAPANAAAPAANKPALELIEAKVPTSAVFAQPVTLVYSFAHEPRYKVELDNKNLPADFEFSNIQAQPNSPGTFTYTITAYPFALKEAKLTPLTFLLKNANGQTVNSFSTQETKISVSKAQTFKDNNFREIRDPFLPFAWFKWLLILLITAGAVYAARYYWKRRQNAARALGGAPIDNRPCDEVALSKIEALIQSGLWERQEYKLFYLTLTDILREYLLRRFNIDTTADTSAEMLRRLKANGEELLTPLLPKLRVFLNSSDLVKFARAVPPETYRNRDIDILRLLIDTTTPKGQELVKDTPARKEAAK